MDLVRELLAETDWSELDHAYGPAWDAPFQLLALLGDDIGPRSAAIGYLDGAILHQDSIYPATGPVARVVAAMLGDPRSMEAVENVRPWDAARRPLRLDLLGFLARVAESCLFDDDSQLRAEAHPAGRDEAELLRMTQDARAALRELGPEPSRAMLVDRVPVPPALAAAARDEEYQRAMRARYILSCQAFLPGIFSALTPILDDPDERIRVKALEVALRLTAHEDLAQARPVLIDRLETAAVGYADPFIRAASARLLGMFGARPAMLLSDPHAGVRACAALAPALAEDQRATRELMAALMTPAEVDHWFREHLPGQEGRLRFDLIQAAVERVSDFADLLPAALALLRLSKLTTFRKDIGPLLAAAFPSPHRDDDQLTPAQQIYLAAIVDRDDLWSPRDFHVATSFQEAGLPYDRDACGALLARAGGR